MNHLFFGCLELKRIWNKVLNWIQLDHEPKAWNEEMQRIVKQSNRKGWKPAILKLTAIETIYDIWKYKNDNIFENNVDNIKIEENIIDMIMHRG